MPFLYETHMHTCLASACGKSTGKEHVRFYRDQGYTGIIVTDHFFGGNTSVDRSLPWTDKMDHFWRGYEDAREEGAKVGLDVFFGLEQGFGDDEYLVYGLEKKWMKEHPAMETWNRRELHDHVRNAGGCMIQAHPFRFRDYNRYIRLGGRFVDGVEVANAGNRPEDDARAYRWAKELNLPMTAGSDNHRSPAQPEKLYGVCLERRLETIYDYVDIILNHKQIGLKTVEGRFDITEETPSSDHLDPAYVLNEKETLIPAGRDWLYS